MVCFISIFYFGLNSYLLHVFTSLVGSSTVFLTSATSAANIVMACHGFGRGFSSIMIVFYPVTAGPEEGSEDVLEGS